jgi:threonine dehydratase
MPKAAPIAKVQATEGYGAKVVLTGSCYDDAYNEALRICEEEGAKFLHPYNDLEVIAGQGTLALEILGDLPTADIIIVPAGGGGLLAGMALAAHLLNPRVKVYGVQAEGAPAIALSFQQKKLVTTESASTIADGIAVKEPGALTYDICQKYLDGVVTVTEDEICAAILALIEQQKMVAEGAGAVSVAAAMFNKVPVAGKKTICIVSGGNIDVTILNRVINRGLFKSGRTYTFVVELDDKPGQLVGVSQIVASLGGNVISVRHERNDDAERVTACQLRLKVETRDEEQINEIRKALKKNHYKLV